MDRICLLRAHPFDHIPYFEETRTDCIMFRASWAERFYGIGMGDYDLKNPEHENAVGYGRAILFFEAWIRPKPGVEGKLHRLVFVEEYYVTGILAFTARHMERGE